MNLIDYWHNTPTLRLIFFLLFIDYVWLNFVGTKFYKTRLNGLNSAEYKTRYYSLALAYVVLILGLSKFVLPLLTPKSTLREIFNLTKTYAIVVYGVFNFTNHAMFEKWDWQISVVDLTWGIILSTVSVWLTMRTAAKEKDPDDEDEDDDESSDESDDDK